jgi:hypothetical protein
LEEQPFCRDHYKHICVYSGIFSRSALFYCSFLVLLI